MIVLIDNYDSFTYNLYQYVGEYQQDIRVIRNDQITVGELRALQPSHVILSPGPGYPEDAGISVEIVRQMGREVPVLGICLGHQAIGRAFNTRIIHGKEPVHGKASKIRLYPSRLFQGIPSCIQGGRYHSLMVDKGTLSPEMRVTAETENGEIMAMEHWVYPLFGLQFHPESVLTEYGREMLINFLNISKEESFANNEDRKRMYRRSDVC